VRDAQVVVLVQDTDPPLVHEFPPTDAEGRTTKTFQGRREAGKVWLVIIVATPDGERGHKSVAYTRR
jgi:hypothetical protein